MILIALLFTVLAAILIFLEVLFIGGLFGALAIVSCVGLGLTAFILRLPFTTVGQIGLLLILAGIVAKYIAKSRKRRLTKRD